jgi:hypothetical protein
VNTDGVALECRACIEPVHLAWFREDLWAAMTDARAAFEVTGNGVVFAVVYQRTASSRCAPCEHVWRTTAGSRSAYDARVLGALSTFALTTAAMIAFAANSLLCRAAVRDGAIDAVSFTAMPLRHDLAIGGAIILGGLALALWQRRAVPAVAAVR